MIRHDDDICTKKNKKRSKGNKEKRNKRKEKTKVLNPSLTPPKSNLASSSNKRKEKPGQSTYFPPLIFSSFGGY